MSKLKTFLICALLVLHRRPYLEAQDRADTLQVLTTVAEWAMTRARQEAERLVLETEYNPLSRFLLATNLVVRRPDKPLCTWAGGSAVEPYDIDVQLPSFGPGEAIADVALSCSEPEARRREFETINRLYLRREDGRWVIVRTEGILIT